MQERDGTANRWPRVHGGGGGGGGRTGGRKRRGVVLQQHAVLLREHVCLADGPPLRAVVPQDRARVARADVPSGHVAHDLLVGRYGNRRSRIRPGKFNVEARAAAFTMVHGEYLRCCAG